MGRYSCFLTRCENDIFIGSGDHVEEQDMKEKKREIDLVLGDIGLS